jgi:hypothetical protein
MIDPATASLRPMVVAPNLKSNQTPAREASERPTESLSAPSGNEAEIRFHHGLIAAAEREFGRLLVQMEMLLQPLV